MSEMLSDSSKVVYERMSENYFEKRRIEYKVVFGFLVATAAIVYYLPPILAKVGNATGWLRLLVGSYFGFTAATVFWLWQLHDTNQKNLKEICELRAALVLEGAARVKMMESVKGWMEKPRRAGKTFFLAQAIAVISAGLATFALVWGLSTKTFNASHAEILSGEAGNSLMQSRAGVSEPTRSVVHLVDAHDMASILGVEVSVVEALRETANLPAMDLSPPAWKGDPLIRYNPDDVRAWAAQQREVGKDRGVQESERGNSDKISSAPNPTPSVYSDARKSPSGTWNFHRTGRSAKQLSDRATVVIAVATVIYTIGTLLLWRESLKTAKAVASTLKLTFLVEYFRAKRDEVLRQAEGRGEGKSVLSDRHRWFSMKEKDYILSSFPELKAMVEEMEEQTRPASDGG